MEQKIEDKLNFKDRFKNYYNHNKIKIYFVLILLFIILASVIFIQYNNEKKNTLIAEKYVQAGLYLASNKNSNAKKLYEEIILSKNKFYSVLALNTIIEKNLISDEKKIMSYFIILEESISEQSKNDLIKLKKALYSIKNTNNKLGDDLLKSLIDENSILKNIAEELLKN
tara:strand:- start:39 stop:548 length:510 start_codon:yes stop_codon:yes gene_type:complete